MYLNDLNCLQNSQSIRFMGKDDDYDDDTLDFGLSTSANHKSFSYECIDVEKIDDDDDDEEEEEEEDPKSELACPFCKEGFTALELCCHIYDEHDSDTNSGICPVCAICVGTNMAAHLISQHKFILKTLHKHKLSDGESQTILSLLRKELKDEHLKSPSARSSGVVSSSSMAPDPLLMPFLYNPPRTDKTAFQDASSTETSLSTKASDKSTLERNIHPKYLSCKDKEKALRFEFVDNLLLSTILDDNL